MSLLLPPAQLEWQNNQPHAPLYNDLYFTDHTGDGGVRESDVFFSAACGLLDLAEVAARISRPVTVLELGFGTGLNFLVAASQLLQHSSAHLHFVSFEQHPLRQADWQRVQHSRQSLAVNADLTAEMANLTLPLIKGWHRRVLAQGRITLSVFHGDATAGVKQIIEHSTLQADAVFLDGFAPDRNTALWTPKLLQQVGQCTRAGGRVATFTAAGAIRRGLEAAGFDMEKSPRQPYKREALTGVKTSAPSLSRQAPMPPSHIRIGGAGIAGASTARHLAELGMSVSVYDPVLSSGKPATQGASHIPHTVLHSRLLAGAEPAADLRQAAFHYTAPWQRRFTGVRDTGALQLQGPNLDEKRLERLCESFGADAPDQAWWIQRLSPHRVAQKLHLDIEQDALWFPTAGVTHLPELCKSLLDHPLIETVGEVLTPDALQPTILCTGIAARDWPGLSWLELQPVAGQLDCYELSNTQFSPTCAVVGNGYVVPASDHNVVLGATYEYSPWPAEKSHTIIADMNDKIINVAAARRTHTQRGVRAVSSDRTPIVGQVEDNLWLNTGMGSMGTTMAPLGASVLAAEFMGWPSGLQPATRALLRPERFIERQQRRGFRHGARPVSDS